MKSPATSLAALLLLSTVSVTPTAAQEPPIGRWRGSIDGEGESTELAIELSRAADGSLAGTAVGPAGETVPLEGVAFTGSTVVFSASALPGEPIFSGELRGDRIEGGVSVVPPPPPPSTDVYLVSLDVDPLAWGLGQPINVTDRDGYDNQPRFLPDSSALLYTSIRNGQADIYRYDLGTRSNRQLTKTPESEYSPTPMPSGDGFSTVRVEADGTQRLWSFDHSGGNPVLLLEETAPVGYHGWLDAHRLGLFVLGSPPTLEVADLGAQTSVVRTNSIGRSIHLTPDGDSMSFVSKPPGGTWTIDVLEIEGTNRRTLMPTPEGSEDFTWAPDGWLVSSQGSRLLVARPGAEEPWQEVANLEGAGVRDITRLDISDDFRWMALVGNRTTAPPARTGRSFVLERVP